MKTIIKNIDRCQFRLSSFLAENEKERNDFTGKISDNLFCTNKVVRSLTGVSGSLAGSLVGLAGSLVGLAGSLVGLAGSLVGLDIIFRELAESRVSADNIFSCYYKPARALPRKG